MFSVYRCFSIASVLLRSKAILGKIAWKMNENRCVCNENKCDILHFLFCFALVLCRQMYRKQHRHCYSHCLRILFTRKSKLPSSIHSYYQNLHQHDKYMVLSFSHSVRKVNANMSQIELIRVSAIYQPAHAILNWTWTFSECKLRVTIQCKRRLASEKSPKLNNAKCNKRCEWEWEDDNDVAKCKLFKFYAHVIID